jgi:metal-dependent amidase/aminoacylase/carboxypeptidase family protein
MIAARFVVDVQSVISREKDPTEFGVVSLGAIHGGTAGGIIPDAVIVLGTIRAFKPEVRAKMLAGIERTAKAVAAMADAPPPDIEISEGAKAVISDPAVVATAEKVLKAAFGEQFRTSPPNTASEDFSEFVNAGVPSMFFNIGVYEPERVAVARNGGPPLPQPFAPVRAGAEAHHRDRRHSDDARRAQHLRSARPGQMRADPGTGQNPLGLKFTKRGV